MPLVPGVIAPPGAPTPQSTLCVVEALRIITVWQLSGPPTPGKRSFRGGDRRAGERRRRRERHEGTNRRVPISTA